MFLPNGDGALKRMVESRKPAVGTASRPGERFHNGWGFPNCVSQQRFVFYDHSRPRILAYG
jgi:hypothetical protein